MYGLGEMPGYAHLTARNTLNDFDSGQVEQVDQLVLITRDLAK
jgi:hypothetical protein